MRQVLMMLSVGLVAVYAAASFGSAAAEQGGRKDEWRNSPVGRKDFFPIAVWLQGPSLAPKYKAMGVNTYIGLWQGPTEGQLAELKKHGMRVICDQNEVGLKHRDDPVIIGWMHGDEPDNFKKNDAGKYVEGPQPEEIVRDYRKVSRRDPTRPVLLNLGQGVANDAFKGSWATEEDYRGFVKGCDVVSYDVYPVTNIGKPDGENYLWYVAKGLRRLRDWTGGRKLIWNVVECTHISDPDHKPTPHQVRAEVWMSIIHGSRGITYFCHQWKPTQSSSAVLNDPPMVKAITAVNRQITELAEVINSPDLDGVAEVESSSDDVPIAMATKRHEGNLVLLTVGMRNGPTTGAFTVRGAADGAEVEVLGEKRTLRARDGKFVDAFGPYDVRMYRIKRSE